jgi:hypothetical protein
MAVNSGRTPSNPDEIRHPSTKEQASRSMAAHPAIIKVAAADLFEGPP